ncbi:MAG: CopG family transcriptional regulator [Opitutaceae bacterium]|nr:CopG family transcriptional regulator [Opitutaceae bacterium]
MKAKDLDKIFDDGEVDITDHLDLAQAFRPGQAGQKRRTAAALSSAPTRAVAGIDRASPRVRPPISVGVDEPRPYVS